MTYIIAQPCVDVLDKSCIEECPVDCIYEGERMLYIHPDECVDCGACEPVCPVEAIFYEDDVPDQWKDFYKANVEFFSDLGSPGGASKVGKINKDHPVVTALPPQGEDELTLATRLPRFPWDLLAPYGQKARAHPDGIVDLSVGTPVDPVPGVVQDALRAAADAPGYPATHGTPALREAAAGWLARRHGVQGRPRRGAAADRHQGVHRRAAGAARLRARGRRRLTRSWPTRPTTSAPGWRAPTRWPRMRSRLPRCPATAFPQRTPPRRPSGPVRLVWVNSPANPTGRVLRRRAAGRDGPGGPRPRRGPGLGRVLHRPRLVGGAAVRAAPGRVRRVVRTACSRCTRCPSGPTWPGYRAGFVTGDPALVAELLEIRKHAGMMMPAPIQAAMTAALRDDAHAERQRDVYAARRDQLQAALEKAGWAITHSEAGLYLWASRPGHDCWSSVQSARRGGHPRRSRGVLRPGRRAAHPGRAHRHRRAGRRRRPPPRRPLLTATTCPGAGRVAASADRTTPPAWTAIAAVPDRPCHGRTRSEVHPAGPTLAREPCRPGWGTARAGRQATHRLSGVLRLYDTRTRQPETIEPGPPWPSRVYSCGPTVYRPAHVGNLRSYLLPDLIRRTVERHRRPSPAARTSPTSGTWRTTARSTRGRGQGPGPGAGRGQDRARGGPALRGGVPRGLRRAEHPARRLLPAGLGVIGLMIDMIAG